MYDIKKFDNCKVIPIWPKTWRTSFRKYLGYGLKQRRFKGIILEFGVFKAVTITIMAKLFPDEEIWGFDSFIGLPEKWKESESITRPKGHFKTEIPKVPHNVRLIQGFFDKTLPQWLKTHNSSQYSEISFLHVDSDLYSSAKTILDLLNDRIKVGTVIAFDEIGNWGEENIYPCWEEGEWKAFNEWLDTYDRDVEVICRSNRCQAMVRVTK